MPSSFFYIVFYVCAIP